VGGKGGHGKGEKGGRIHLIAEGPKGSSEAELLKTEKQKKKKKRGKSGSFYSFIRAGHRLARSVWRLDEKKGYEAERKKRKKAGGRSHEKECTLSQHEKIGKGSKLVRHGEGPKYQKELKKKKKKKTNNKKKKKKKIKKKTQGERAENK